MNIYSSLDEYEKEEDKIGMKIQKLKNNAPAGVQITAEQLIKESQAHRTDDIKIPIQHISDIDELNEYKLKKRKEFEDQIKRQKYHIGCWMKYAAWEEHLGEFVRARSVYERALEIDYRNTTIWLKYAEMEMRNKFINHARNVWERACKYLPRVDQFWYKFAYMEEMLGNYVACREIFNCWMSWEPSDLAWLSFAKFEERLGEIERAREVLYRYIEVHPKLLSYMRVAKFEEKHHNKESCRRLYESALADLGNEALSEDYFISFIRFEMRCREYDRCRVLFKFALDHISKEKSAKLQKLYIKFEKMYGTKESNEEVIVSKRRIHYEKEIEKNPLNYDNWFDYIKLEEQFGQVDRVREIYERAIVNLPPISEKKYWRRYIFLWINYAIYEECTANNVDRANEVYRKCIEIIPHKKFSFSKIWILYAHFLLRSNNLDHVRKVFGMSIALCPREKVFNSYIDLEMQLGNIERVRKIYEKFLECQPENSNTWVKYAELEKNLDERERCEAILEIATTQTLDIPEIVWKAYINIEISYKDYEKVRILYERLLDKTKHAKVWLSYAKFEQEIEEFSKSRNIYERGYKYFKNTGMKEERLLLLENWIKSEEVIGDEDMLNYLNSIRPEKVKRRRRIPAKEEEAPTQTEEEVMSNELAQEWEEYYDYIFPDDEQNKKSLKILAKAMQWAKEKETDHNENE